MNIKVTVDYYTGSYDVTSNLQGNMFGYYHSGNHTQHKPIRGIDRDGIPKIQYSKIIKQKRKEELEKRIDELNAQDPSLKLSKKILKHLDFTLYKALEDWDILTRRETNYATTFLKIVAQNFEKPTNRKISSREFQKQCREKIARDLKNAGIDLTYNLGVFKIEQSEIKHRNLTLSDKIKGMFIARKQKKYIGAKVKHNLFLSEPVFLEDQKLYFSNSTDTSESLEHSKENMSKSTKNQKNKIHTQTINENKSKNSRRTAKNNFSTDSVKIINVNLNEVSNNRSHMRKNNLSRYGKTSNCLKKSWKRKLHDVKDSIKNKIYIPKKFKKIAIRGAVTLLATSGIAFSAHTLTHIVKDNIIKNNYETEFDTFETEKLRDIVIIEPKTGVHYENQSETPKETESNTQSVTPIEIQSESQSESSFSMQSESQNETIPSIETEKQSESQNETISNIETEKQSELQTQSESEQGTQKDSQNVSSNKKSNKQTIKQFKKEATEKYMESFVIGEHPNVGDLFEGQIFSANPDGTGSIGHFDKHPNYEMERVYVITDEDWYTVTAEDKSLPEILSEYPDLTGYCIHFTDADTGGNLGFVTQSQLNDIVSKKVTSIVKNKKIAKSKQNTKIASQSNQEIER